MACKETITWGVIGCGDVVETKNGPAFYLADYSELKGIWNRTKSKAEAWCERHGHGRAYDTMEELLSDPEIDIIYVATTPNCHKDQAIAVAEAGKHCYVEKPIALSWDDAQEIKAAFEKSGTRCFVAHYRRGMPRYLKAKQLIDNGAIGKVRGVQVIRTQRQTAEEMLPEDQKPWRVRKEVSGGSHFYEGDAHMLDLIDFLVGPMAEFKLEVSNETGYYEAEDVVSLAGITAEGVMVSGLWCYATYKAIDKFLVFGDKGSLSFSYYDGAAPLHLETLPTNVDTTAHEGVMGGVREEPEMVEQDITFNIDPYPGLGNIQIIVDELRGVEGAKCASTLENALRTLRITSTAQQMMQEQSATKDK